MKYLLVLVIYSGGITVFPEKFENKESCTSSGQVFKVSINRGDYMCMPVLENNL